MSDTLIDTGLTYAPGDPVLVRVRRRPLDKVSVSDCGAALARARRASGWRGVAAEVARELVVNVNRHGEVCLPVVAVGPGEEEIVRRIGAASRRLYLDALDLDG